MKAPALVAVNQPADAFTALFAAAAARDARVGWLDLAAAVEPPAVLGPAAAAGAAKAVAVSPGGAIAWKRRRGAPLLRDLLREHFLGYLAVLVRGGEGWPRLSLEGDVYKLAITNGSARQGTAEEILDVMRVPSLRFPG